MENNQFRLIAIRAFENSVGRRKLIAKKLYYFYQGYKIENSLITLDKSLITPIDLYNRYFDNDSRQIPVVSFSAIAGQNGSGKSSVIEFALRLINNFAASTIGEYKVNPVANHLYYVDGIYGELYYLMDDVFYRLKVEGRNVVLDEYTYNGENENIRKYIPYVTSLFDNELSLNPNVDSEPFRQWRERGKTLKDYYQHFFYTFVSNFSIYAYNTLDFKDECNSQAYEQKIRGNKKNYTIDNRCWLNGIFHKNDGYQTPVVLSPFRNRGNLDINTENKLAKERLISLMIRSDSNFRIINEHLDAQTFTLTKKNIIYNATYLKENEIFLRLQARGYDLFEKLITQYWGEVLNINLTTFKDQRIFYTEAIGYLTCKTLKISANYSQYNYFMKKHEGIYYNINQEQLKKLIDDLSKDASHITRKIRQVLSYIIYGIYDQVNENKKIVIKSVSISAARALLENKKYNNDEKVFSLGIDDFVPPPIFVTRINMVDTYTNSKVIFETLSSGERQQAYSISSFLYHLVNLNSVALDKNNKRIAYKHINIILEEIELYFHPELQRNFVKYILDGIKQVDLSNINALNICVVTHSPFILSDIPANNILLLNKDAKPGNCGDILKTFGANIHDMLKESFFLERGSIGEFSQWVINRLAIVLKILVKVKNMSQNGFTIEGTFLEEPIYNKDEEYIFLHDFIREMHFNILMFRERYNADTVHQLIMLFDEPIIRNVLLEEYHKVFKENDKEKKIKELKQQLRDLGENI